jgi:hypothetical protein
MGRLNRLYAMTAIGAERKLMFEVRCFRVCPNPAIGGASPKALGV